MRLALSLLRAPATQLFARRRPSITVARRIHSAPLIMAEKDVSLDFVAYEEKWENNFWGAREAARSCGKRAPPAAAGAARRGPPGHPPLFCT